MHVATVTFAELGLSREAPDVLVWQTCQDQEVLLVTNNRKAEGPDSLETTIRLRNRETSLPVITLGDAKRVLWDRDYAARAAERPLDIILNLDDYRGAGRLYIP